MNAEKLKPYIGCENVLACPVCHSPLSLSSDASLHCSNNHCFNIARQGYANLLLHHKTTGPYDRDSFVGRRAIFSSGLYDTLAYNLCDILRSFDIEGTLADAGCGEGFFSSFLSRILPASTRFISFDLNKDSIRLAAAGNSNNNVIWLVSDIASMPIQDHVVDSVLNVFAPANYSEFRRILLQNGIIVKVVPTSNHFAEIRNVVSAELVEHGGYSNNLTVQRFTSFCKILEWHTVTSTINPTKEEMAAATAMTPILFHINRGSYDWASISSLTMEADILIGTFR